MTNLINVYVSVLSKLPVLVLIVFAASSVIIGDYAAKAWSENHKVAYLLCAFLGYFFSGFFYIPTLLREGLIISSVIWGLLSTIGFVIIGWLIFKEALSFTQIIAIAFGIVSILILTIFD